MVPACLPVLVTRSTIRAILLGGALRRTVVRVVGMNLPGFLVVLGAVRRTLVLLSVFRTGVFIAMVWMVDQTHVWWGETIADLS